MPCSHAADDALPSGFTDRAPLAEAWAWLDRWAITASAESVPLAEAADRVLADPVVASAAPSGQPRSVENGYAVRAADCDGASAYNPLPLSLRAPGASELPAGAACPIASGLPLPHGADAVLPFEAAQRTSARFLEVLAPVARGTGIERSTPLPGDPQPGPQLERGSIVRPRHVGYLAALGIARVTVFRRPRVAVVVPGPKSGSDALTPMLGALLARDRAEVDWIPVAGDGEPALRAALGEARRGMRDLVLIAGRAGMGPDDMAAPALAAAGGTMALHGLALRPGMASGVGTLPRGDGAGTEGAEPDRTESGTGGTEPDTIPVILLPGEPLACLVAYDMLAARLVRRLAGADPTSPYPVAECALARKIASVLGLFEVVPVRLAGGQAMPIGADAGLPGAARADGFVMVADASEGYPQGARVRVHFYDTPPAAAAWEANP